MVNNLKNYLVITVLVVFSLGCEGKENIEDSILTKEEKERSILPIKKKNILPIKKKEIEETNHSNTDIVNKEMNKVPSKNRLWDY